MIGASARAVWGLRATLEEPRFRIVGLVDTIPQRMELLAGELPLGGVPIFSNFDACLDGVDFDAVVILTPDSTHADLAVTALRRGKWVYVEKPLDISAERAGKVVRADREAGGRTFVGFNLRFAPVYQNVNRLVRQGVAGRILTIQADEFYSGGRTYFRRWNRLRAMGGGLWITKACHDFDLLYWMAGDKPESVFARCGLSHFTPKEGAAPHCRDCNLAQNCPDRYDFWTPPKSATARLNAVTETVTGVRPDLCLYGSDKDTFDHGVATVTFRNGVIATYTLNVVAGITNRRMRINGTKATIDADLMSGEVVIWGRDPSTVERLNVGDGNAHGGGDRKMIPAFANFINGDSSLYISPAEAAISVQVGEAATQSCDQGTVINLA